MTVAAGSGRISVRRLAASQVAAASRISAKIAASIAASSDGIPVASPNMLSAYSHTMSATQIAAPTVTPLPTDCRAERTSDPT